MLQIWFLSVYSSSNGWQRGFSIVPSSSIKYVTTTPIKEHTAGTSPNPYLVTEKLKLCCMFTSTCGEVAPAPLFSSNHTSHQQQCNHNISKKKKTYFGVTEEHTKQAHMTFYLRNLKTHKRKHIHRVLNQPTHSAY